MAKREIKFRAWDTILKSMVEVFTIHWDGDNEIIGGYFLNKYGEENAFDNELQKLELMQFTGLTDKNGKDVYEGDIIETRILKCEMSNNGMDFENNRDFCAGHHIKRERYVASMNLDVENNLIYPMGVQELPECFLPEEDAVPDEYTSLEEMKSDIGLIEIIGNVYENKTLLSDGKI